jgi:hypothetical protein
VMFAQLDHAGMEQAHKSFATTIIPALKAAKLP